MEHITLHLKDEVVNFFIENMFPAYESSRKRSGFRWDTLERRNSPKHVPDMSIKAQVANAYKILGDYTGTAEWRVEAEAAADELEEAQADDGRWECPYKIPTSSLEDTFQTADAVWFLSRMGRKQSAQKGVTWLLTGKVEPMSGVPPDLDPLHSLLAYKQANHVGSIIRALVAYSQAMGNTEALSEALWAGRRLCESNFQKDYGSWGWALDHPDVVKTVYHDLTVWGLVDLYKVTGDRMLEGPLQAALDFLRLELGTIRGLYPRQHNSASTGYSGLITLVKCMKCFGTSEIAMAAFDLLMAIFGRFKPSLIPGASPPRVERRLEVLRGLTVFMEEM